MSKECYRCGQIKPCLAFGNYKIMKDGLNRNCKSCVRERMRELQDTPEIIAKRAAVAEQRALIASGFRKCSTCGEVKAGTRENFYGNQGSLDGLHAKCLECFYREAPGLGYMHRYGITIEERDTIFESQNQRCAICHQAGLEWGNSISGWALDHNHRTGRIRGVLCGHCNTGIGHLRDDTTTLASAIAYLEFHDSLDGEEAA